jgi:hypothetical protein
MKALATIFLISMVMISSCASVPSQPQHPILIIPTTPELPKFSRDMLDCGQHNPDDLPLCIRIKEREETLRYHIETLETLVNIHNLELQ